MMNEVALYNLDDCLSLWYQMGNDVYDGVLLFSKNEIWDGLMKFFAGVHRGPVAVK